MKDYIDDVHKEYMKIFDQLWELIEKEAITYCFDCGKQLKKEEICIMVDKNGMLGFCRDCTWRQIEHRDLWRKILNRRKKDEEY